MTVNHRSLIFRNSESGDLYALMWTDEKILSSMKVDVRHATQETLTDLELEDISDADGNKINFQSHDYIIVLSGKNGPVEIELEFEELDCTDETIKGYLQKAYSLAGVEKLGRKYHSLKIAVRLQVAIIDGKIHSCLGPQCSKSVMDLTLETGGGWLSTFLGGALSLLSGFISRKLGAFLEGLEGPFQQAISMAESRERRVGISIDFQCFYGDSTLRVKIVPTYAKDLDWAQRVEQKLLAFKALGVKPDQHVKKAIQGPQVSEKEGGLNIPSMISQASKMISFLVESMISSTAEMGAKYFSFPLQVDLSTEMDFSISAKGDVSANMQKALRWMAEKAALPQNNSIQKIDEVKESSTCKYEKVAQPEFLPQPTHFYQQDLAQNFLAHVVPALYDSLLGGSITMQQKIDENGEMLHRFHVASGGRASLELKKILRVGRNDPGSTDLGFIGKGFSSQYVREDERGDERKQEVEVACGALYIGGKRTIVLSDPAVSVEKKGNPFCVQVKSKDHALEICSKDQNSRRKRQQRRRGQEVKLSNERKVADELFAVLGDEISRQQAHRMRFTSDSYCALNGDLPTIYTAFSGLTERVVPRYRWRNVEEMKKAVPLSQQELVSDCIAACDENVHCVKVRFSAASPDEDSICEYLPDSRASSPSQRFKDAVHSAWKDWLLPTDPSGASDAKLLDAFSRKTNHDTDPFAVDISTNQATPISQLSGDPFAVDTGSKQATPVSHLSG
eukprot:gnl/MRDRNA2_/MRDRNA2_181555_c0_seq1.p1 gnl/MRDRNA2_/MRDRNA2_181555_c0~~gnl/MRDRNA2_/MRDRNA2_181555_c0_seq1.p1  ORF type:complete len:784 (+),score=126.21 gnl/MRDRNA2_/MRDRNA2_181555_c0_seq1:152-2353(+)